MPGRLSRFRRLGRADRALLLEAVAWLAAARLLVLAMPLRLLSRLLAGSASAPADGPGAEALGRIGWALNAAGNRVPWRSLCLERAIAGKLMLRLRGFPSALFLGVARPERGGPVKAHAWLRCGGLPVVGEDAATEAYAVVARFAETARRSPTG